MASSAAAGAPAAGGDPQRMPTLWTHWARSVPVLLFEDCEVEVESDLSFIRFSVSVEF